MMDTKDNKPAKKRRLPHLDLTKEELIASIKEAENGKFFTIEEFERDFEVWKREKGFS
jgi:hypothetical protein